MSADSRATVNLAGLALADGAATSAAGPVPIEPLALAGQSYVLRPDAPSLRLDVSRALQGHHLRLRGDAVVVGPCWRCLDEAAWTVTLDVHEFAGLDEDDEDVRSEYVDGDVLRLADWARDAISEALPASLLCRPDCAGLCPACGTNLNDATCECPDPAPDARWAPLGEIARRLSEPG